jgi:DUF1680 family protein
MSEYYFKKKLPISAMVGGVIGKRYENTLRKNLFSLDYDHDFMAPFLGKNIDNQSYVGLGKTLEALVRFAYYTQDAQALSLKNRLFAELIGAQTVDGYIGSYTPEKRVGLLWDLHETSYLIRSLIADYKYFGSEDSLKSGIAAADYTLSKLTAETVASMYHIKSGDTAVCIDLCVLGFEWAMLDIYNVTGNCKYKDAVGIFGLKEWKKDIILGRKDGVHGQAYVFLYRCWVQLKLYAIEHDQSLMGQTERVLDFLRSEGGLLITGTCGVNECFYNTQDGRGHLGETCATAYFIRLLKTLLELKGDSVYGDIMERSIYNALFGAQSPSGRELRYYTPFSGKREYWSKDTYCCPGNFRNIISELPEMICLINGDGVMFNLYTESTVEMCLPSGNRVSFKQDTSYPEDGSVSINFTVERLETFKVMLRIPGWCRNYKIKLNGDAADGSLLDGFFVMRGKWKTGDLLQIEFDMPGRLIKGFRMQEGKVAVMRGPTVFCFNPDLNPHMPLEELPLWSVNPDSIIMDRRNGNLFCCVGICKDGKAMEILLTPFVDPGGQETYFNIACLDNAVSDELLTLKDPSLWRVEEKSEKKGWNGQ